MIAAARALEAGDFETAVSRAYYASYHAIIAAFEAKMGFARARWSHNFKPYFDRFAELEDLRLVVADLYVARIKADYEETTFAEGFVENLLQQARHLVVRVGEVVRDEQV
jgi:uncharacterized protein (UPF0332 family)